MSGIRKRTRHHYRRYGKDLAIIKNAKINGVRTSHYPNQITWYYLCDQAGIHVMAETNLESHGSWQKMGAFEPSYNVPGAVPQWQAAVLDRAKTNFETLKTIKYSFLVS